MEPLFAQGERFDEVVPSDHQEIVKLTQKGGSLALGPEPVELAIDYIALTNQGSVPTEAPPFLREGRHRSRWNTPWGNSSGSTIRN